MSNNITRLLTALVGATDQGAGIQGLEDAATACLTQETLDTAVGAQLQIIAKIVGQDPSGLDDPTLRAYCRARIQAHRSKGAADSIIKVATLAVNNSAAVIKLQPEGTATLRLFVLGVAITDTIGGVVHLFGQLAAAAGVRLVVEWLPTPASPVFQFDGPAGTGFDDAPFAGDVG